MSVGADILEALRTRIATITTTAGYANTIKTVLLNDSQQTARASEADLPLVEIKDDAEVYEHMASSAYNAYTIICLFLVAPRSWSDRQFQDLMSDIRKAIYGASATATGNTGMRFHQRVTNVELVDAASDLNLVGSNRTYLMRLRLTSLRITYRD